VCVVVVVCAWGGGGHRWMTGVLKPMEDQGGLLRRPSSLLSSLEAYVAALLVLEGRGPPQCHACVLLLVCTPLHTV
jgi:hypothetical protein